MHLPRPVVLLALAPLLLPACRKQEDAAAEAAAHASQEAEGLYVRATSEFVSGKFQEALETLQASKALNPQDRRIPAALGEVYFALRRLPEARAAFEEATRVNPERATNWARLGMLQLLQGDTAPAEASYRTALERSPRDADALEGMGDVALKLGNLDEAVKRYVQAAETGSELARPGLYLRAVELLTAKKRDADAAKLLKEAAGKFADLPGEIHAKLGELLVLGGDLDGATVAYVQAAERTPSAVHWEIVGELKARAGQAKDAEAAWRNALAHGENAVVRVQLARLALKRQDRAAAELELAAALREAKGEERRESKELAALLADMDRKPDALKLLAVVASEPDAEKDVALQLQAARLARDLGDKAVVGSACARARAAGAAACP
ncbi:MAG: hypothetical protein RL653_4133 [Pseudomonadota bacterium]|jgi:tetratricopeptide (TPR) repeat protein